MALKKLPSLTLIEPGENIGYVRANNLGLQQCKGRYVLFLNNDNGTTAPVAADFMRLYNSDGSYNRQNTQLGNPRQLQGGLRFFF
ncbi:MAG: hypothetical protein NTW74_13135, partial [Acidobacteria bacterium]|nr:hypothetical protein [Acidobacteriota bacterium]